MLLILVKLKMLFVFGSVYYNRFQMGDLMYGAFASKLL